MSLAPLLLAAGCGSTRFYAHFVPYYFAGPKPSAQCGQGQGFRYCAYRAPPGAADDPESVLYFFHYGGGSEESWSSFPAARVYYAEFKKRGLPAPRVVAVSYGGNWVLFDKPGPKSAGLFGPFVSEALPWLEDKFGRPRRRYVWGMSQGSLNAGLVVLKKPELWSGAVFSCPGFSQLSPFASPAEIDAFIKRTRADRAKVQSWLKLVRERVAGPEAWTREDPLARALSASGLPPVYIDCTREDEYGFFEGAARMAEILRERGQNAEFVAESGEHCQLDARGVAVFLAELSRQGRAAGNLAR